MRQVSLLTISLLTLLLLTYNYLDLCVSFIIIYACKYTPHTYYTQNNILLISVGWFHWFQMQMQKTNKQKNPKRNKIRMLNAGAFRYSYFCPVSSRKSRSHLGSSMWYGWISHNISGNITFYYIKMYSLSFFPKTPFLNIAPWTEIWYWWETN